AGVVTDAIPSAIESGRTLIGTVRPTIVSWRESLFPYPRRRTVNNFGTNRCHFCDSLAIRELFELGCAPTVRRFPCGIVRRLRSAAFDYCVRSGDGNSAPYR